MIRRVFDGGAGEDNGGILEKSSDSGDRDRFSDNEGDEGPECGGDRCRFDVCIGESMVGDRLVAAMTAAIVLSDDCVEGAVVSSFGSGLVEDMLTVSRIKTAI